MTVIGRPMRISTATDVVFRRLKALLLVLGALWAILIPGVAAANMAQPWSPGDPVGEPSGALWQIEVLHEQLRLDLRPFEARQPAIVEATYRVRNSAGPAAVDLVFVAPGLTSGSVALDGRVLPAQPVERLVLPDEWSAPNATPGFDGRDMLYEVRTSAGAAAGLAFQAVIPPGEHEVRVQYSVRPGENHWSVYRAYQLGYVLAPARSWGGFGTLDLEVHVPSGWEVASTLPLQRTGDVLAARFQGIPADTLGLTVRHPVPANGDIEAGEWMPLAGFYLAGIVAIGAGVAAGRFIGKRSSARLRHVAIALATLLGVVVAAVVLPMIAYLAWIDALDLVESQRSPGWNYSGGSWPLLLGVVGSVSYPVICLATLVISRWRARRWQGQLDHPARQALQESHANAAA